MNKTKKMTQGAMMLAIFGALCGIDRAFGHLFDVYISLLVPVLIVVYTAINAFSDGIVLSVGLFIINFIVNGLNITYLVYTIIGIFVGVAYSYALKKNCGSKVLLLIAIVTYVIGELITFYIIQPLLGISINDYALAYMEELKNLFSSVSMGQIYEASGINSLSLVLRLMAISTVLIGVMEGVMIHMIIIFLLKRFKIKDIGALNISSIKPNMPLTYICMFFWMLNIFAGRFLSANQHIQNIVFTLGTIGLMVLFFYGYLFVLAYFSRVLHRRPGFILLFMLIIFGGSFLSIIGFLYGSGPLMRYIENKEKIVQE